VELAVCAQSACQVVLWKVGKQFCDDMLAERSLPLDTPGTCRKVMSAAPLRSFMTKSREDP
jgi:hypothetical protein